MTSRAVNLAMFAIVLVEFASGVTNLLVAPGVRSFNWVNWVVEIEVGEFPAWFQPPLPLQ